jgi:rare lipoprotein A
MKTAAAFFVMGLLACAPAALAEDVFVPADEQICVDYQPRPAENSPLLQRMFRYTQLALKHRVEGLASYYSSFFDGRKTANGEIYRNQEFSAAHLTLPLGTWIEVTSRATGRKLRLRVNDRGPYVKKFCLDLSQAAAHYLGVDTSSDRHVEFRIIALPGEEPISEESTLTPGS